MCTTLRRLWIVAACTPVLLSGCVLQLHWHLHLDGADHEKTLELDGREQKLPGGGSGRTPWDLLQRELGVGRDSHEAGGGDHNPDGDRDPVRSQETGTEEVTIDN